MFRRRRINLISVLPKNYRSIALYAARVAVDPVILMDRIVVEDLSDRGPVTQRGIRRCINFEVRDGAAEILGFHDHPNEMWIAEAYSELAEYCEQQGWLKIEGPHPKKPL